MALRLEGRAVGFDNLVLRLVDGDVRRLDSVSLVLLHESEEVRPSLRGGSSIHPVSVLLVVGRGQTPSEIAGPLVITHLLKLVDGLVDGFHVVVAFVHGLAQHVDLPGDRFGFLLAEPVLERVQLLLVQLQQLVGRLGGGPKLLLGRLGLGVALGPVLLDLAGVGRVYEVELPLGQVLLGGVEPFLHEALSVDDAGEVDKQVAAPHLVGLHRLAQGAGDVGVEPALGQAQDVIAEGLLLQDLVEGGLVAEDELDTGSEGGEGDDGGHERDRPRMDADREDTVVEAVDVVGHEQVDLVKLVRRQEDVERDVRVHEHGVGIEPPSDRAGASAMIVFFLNNPLPLGRRFVPPRERKREREREEVKDGLGATCLQQPFQSLALGLGELLEQHGQDVGRLRPDIVQDLLAEHVDRISVDAIVDLVGFEGAFVGGVVVPEHDGDLRDGGSVGGLEGGTVRRRLDDLLADAIGRHVGSVRVGRHGDAETLGRRRRPD